MHATQSAIYRVPDRSQVITVGSFIHCHDCQVNYPARFRVMVCFGDSFYHSRTCERLQDGKNYMVATLRDAVAAGLSECECLQ